MTAYLLYILECAGGTLYTGITTDLENRLAAHRNGTGSRYVRAHLPIKVIYTEKLPDRSEASKREQQIKSWTRSEKISKLGLKVR
jgi:putative endonuclease